MALVVTLTGEAHWLCPRAAFTGEYEIRPTDKTATSKAKHNDNAKADGARPLRKIRIVIENFWLR